MAPGSDPGDDAGSLRARLAAAEARIAQLDEWLDVTFEHSPVAMAIISAFENRYERVNRAFEELIGRSREEIMSVDPFSFSTLITHPEDRIADQVFFGEMAVGARRSYQVEKRFLRPDGSFRWGHLCLSAAFQPAPGPGLAVGALRFVVAQVIDITEQKATAEALRRRELELRHAQRIDGIGRLAGGIAHDFNNLLTVIAGHGEMLQDLLADDASAPPPQDVRDNLDAILAASERAAGLTAQLLAHGRRGIIVPRAFVLSDAVATMQRLLVRVIGSDIESDQRLDAVGSIFADQGQIGQVVMNLVLNARDAMPEGGRLTLATRDLVVVRDGGSVPRGAWVALIVSDTGHGMTPEVRARMFEPFFTTREDRPGTQGTGLGLATVERIVVEAGGHIAVESEPGRGTSVMIHFPRVAALTRPEDPRAASQLSGTPNSERVLVVEDEASVRALVASVLAGAHYDVTAARNGEEALAFVAAAPKPFDLIVTDLVMARVGGAALAKQLAARGHSTRMLFISGYSDHTPDELVPFGTLLPKPFTPSQLLVAVRKALEDGKR